MTWQVCLQISMLDIIAGLNSTLMSWCPLTKQSYKWQKMSCSVAVKDIRVNIGWSAVSRARQTSTRSMKSAWCHSEGSCVHRASLPVFVRALNPGEEQNIIPVTTTPIRHRVNTRQRDKQRDVRPSLCNASLWNECMLSLPAPQKQNTCRSFQSLLSLSLCLSLSISLSLSLFLFVSFYPSLL